MKYNKIREESLKKKVGEDWFGKFDTTNVDGAIDFTVLPKQKSLYEQFPLLWAEAKTGDYSISSMFAQLILTIGKSRIFDKTVPPAFIGVFDFKKIAFLDYVNIEDLFLMNDFNWKVTPSNHSSKEFRLIKDRIESGLDLKIYLFDFLKDEKELRFFIENNIAKGTSKGKISINKNNFIPIYLRWLELIKPIIDVNWMELKKFNIIESDFYLADLFVDDNRTVNVDDDISIRDGLFVSFQNQGYKISKSDFKSIGDIRIGIRNLDIYTQFWKIYRRPPIKDFQDYIIERRDLLVPQDIRERKGAFFTPRIWVELSQKYIADYLGDDWQDEYYVWDCASGTGNLLAGLVNKKNIYASTLDQADINVLHERIDKGANLYRNQVFQFDFLNDEFIPISRGGKIPDSLFDIINNTGKRKNLVIYINPPYAEADNRIGEGRKGVAESLIHKKYSKKMGYTKREMYIQFLTRIYFEIPDALIANFSTLKNLQAPRFSDFRIFFKARLEKLFLTPASTFDNVRGDFPIGFFIWNTKVEEDFKFCESDVYDKTYSYAGSKNIWSYDNVKFINDWVKTFRNSKSESIATIIGVGSDFQNQRLVRFGEPYMKVPASNHNWQTTKENLIQTSIYYTVRKIINANWLNDRDQFLYPNDNWKTDIEFQNDCLAYTLFSNNVSSSFGKNNWIPFTEQELNIQNRFESNFMTDFISGKVKLESDSNLFKSDQSSLPKREFSEEAIAVFVKGREIWSYYHSKPFTNINASLYDIREHFQGRNTKGRMNSKSNDEIYTTLITELRDKLYLLSHKIVPKIYEYGFLLK